MSRSKKGAPKRWRWVRAFRPAVPTLRKLIGAGDDLSSIKSLERAFREFNLDKKKQIDWQILSALLAIRLFDTGAGRPLEWDTARQLDLLQQVHQRKLKNSYLTDRQICQFIARDKRSPDFVSASSKGEGLRKEVRRARRQFLRNTLARSTFPLAFLKTGDKIR